MNIRKLVAYVSFGTLTLFAGSAFAARTGTSLTIDNITVYHGNARIYIASGLSGTSLSCGSAHPNDLGIPLGTAHGTALLNLATAAMLSGRLINVTGSGSTGDCVATDFDAQRLVQLTLLR